MDPNETLKEIRRVSAEIKESHEVDEAQVDVLIELVEALDEWLVKGGFAPSDWPLVGMAR